MRRSTPSEWASVGINVVGLISNLYALYNINFVYKNPHAVGFGGHFQYLTILGLTSATLTFAVKIVRFFVSGACDAFYHSVSNIAIPLEGLISLLYWPMAYADPHLLVPKDMPPLSTLVDCSLHLNPAVLLWIDFLVFNVEFKRDKRHIVVIYGCTAFYLVWSWTCKTINGYWPYPFLDSLSNLGRLFFYLFCGTLCWIIYEAGALAHVKLHRKVKCP